MKIMLDTNVLISALIFGGTAGRLMECLLDSGFEVYVSEYIDRELYDKLHSKWKEKADRAYELYRSFDICFCTSTDQVLGCLRDDKDIPVLSDAIYHKVDVLITGDKDFLEEEIEKPIVMSPGMFLEYIER